MSAKRKRIQPFKIKEIKPGGDIINLRLWFIRYIVQPLLILFLLFGIASAQEMKTLLKSPVQLSKNQGTIDEILTELMTDHRINFSFDPKIIPFKKLITLEIDNQTLEGILYQTFEGTDVKYTVMEDIIILSERKKYTVSGFVEDEKSGERLIGASVIEHTLQNGTVSNNYGFFSLTTMEGEVIIHVSYVGYTPLTERFVLGKDTSIIWKLSPGMEIAEVTISANSLEDKYRNSEVGVENLNMRSMATLPSLLGEGDIMRVMQYLPGIQFGTEASTGLVVRGGSPEQNLILLDGVPVYNSNHAFGLFSVFNSDAIKSLKLYKGGFPARYGGRLSSVIDVRMKEGNMKKIQGSVNVGLIASKITLEGPILKDKVSFIISARRTYIDLFLPEGEESDIPGFHFYDINSKINYQISSKDRIYLSFYLGNDQFTEEEKFNDPLTTYKEWENNLAVWGNRTSLLRWNHIYNSKLFSNLSLLFSDYGLKIKVDEKEESYYDYKYEATIYNSGISDLSTDLNFDYYPNASNDVKFGINYIYHSFNPGKLHKISEEYYYTAEEKIYPPTGNIDEKSSNAPVYAHEFRTYIENDFTLRGWLYANLGLHYSGFLVKEEYYSSLEPRISARFPITKNLIIDGAYSRMRQYIHLLTHSSMGLPTDLWLPVTSEVKPQYSNQYSFGLTYTRNAMYELNIEGYFKSLHQIYAYKEGVDYLSTDNSWEKNIELGRGRSYGIAFTLRKQIGKLTGWFTYAWSKTDRQFEEVNFGKPFPYKYDRTNQVNAVAKYAFTENLSCNATWIYGTGMAYSLSTAKYSSLFNLYNWNAPDNPAGYIDVYENRNNRRMPDYHRLDLSLEHFKQRKRFARTLNLTVYNVYGRFNPYLIYWDEDMSDGGIRKVKQVALFSVVPSISCRIEF